MKLSPRKLHDFKRPFDIVFWIQGLKMAYKLIDKSGNIWDKSLKKWYLQVTIAEQYGTPKD